MSEKRKRQATGMAHATEAAAEGVSGFRHQFRTEVGHFAAFDVVPNTFGGIEVGGITGKPFDLYPVALGPQVLRHFPAAMSRQVVPDEDDSLAAHEALELLEEIDETGGVKTVFLGPRKQPSRLTIPTEPQRCRDRSLIPVITARL